MLTIGVISLFPEMFQALHYGITGRAIKQGLLDLRVFNPRDYTQDRHRTVDDRPYGGGAGMVMMVEPLIAAIETARAEIANAKVVYLTPQGKALVQTEIQTLTSLGNIIFIAGRYEGIDERVIELAVDIELSLGDFVLSGGELAAMAVIDSMTRLLPGALGDAQSAAQDTFTAGLVEYPQYTRPEVIAGLQVPQVLLSGDHQAIARWRQQQALGRTWRKRPDLLAKLDLSVDQEDLLTEYIREFEAGEKP